MTESVSRSAIDTNGGRTSFRATGSGPPLVLVHGMQVGQELFDDVRGHLEDAFTVITYDQRDRGGTWFPVDAYTAVDLADDLAALIRGLGYERAHVVGTSYGGMVAQMFAIGHPALLDRLILASTGQHPFGTGRLPRDAQDLLDDVQGGDESAGKALPGRFASAAAATSKSIAAVKDGTGASSPEALGRRLAAVRGFDTRGLLGTVTAPALVLHGRNDPVIRIEDSVAMALELSRGSLLLLDGVGHAWENEEPETAARLLTAFLGAARA